MPTVEVKWVHEVEEQDLQPQRYVDVPLSVYNPKRDSLSFDDSDPVSDWLSDTYGWIVEDWNLKGCNYKR